MKKLLLVAALCVASLPFGSAIAAESYNQNITAIFGAGNPNDGWATGSDLSGDIVLGLRGKERTTGNVPESGDIYGPFNTGIVPPGRATWNWEFSMDVDALGTSDNTLNMFRFELWFDTDPTVGTSFVVFDPLAVYGDNSLGNFGTANGAGVEPGVGSYHLYSIAQNSQNIVFMGLNPFVDATYSTELRAYDLQDNLLAQVSIDNVVGEGGGPAPVPEPATVVGGLMLGALIGGTILKRKKQ